MGIVEIIITAGLLFIAILGGYTLGYINGSINKCYREWMNKN